MKYTSTAVTLCLCAAAFGAATVPVTVWAQVAPVRLGTSTNGIDGYSNDAHRIAVDPERNLVVFIHSQDVTIWGGGVSASGRFRVDVSLDGGATFTTDLGLLNDTESNYTTVPNAVIPRDSVSTWSLVWGSTGRNFTFARDGFVSGQARGTTSSAEVLGTSWGLRRLAGGISTFASLCEGEDGVYWGILRDTVRTAEPTFWLLQGVTAPDGDVLWAIEEEFTWNAGGPSEGEFVPFLAPSIAFSPDGTVGWVAWLGAEAGGDADKELHLMLSRSLDAGSNWTTPVEVPLATVGWDGSARSLADALLELDADATGRPTATGELDITVDGEGQVHLLLNVANAVDAFNEPWRPDTTVGHILVDVVSAGTEFSFTAHEIAFLNTHTSVWGAIPGDSFAPGNYEQGNRPHIARNLDGSAVFYAWTDSPLTLIPEVGGENVAPSLFVSGMNAHRRSVLPVTDITSTDIFWSGQFLLWSMGPVVLEDDESFRLPIVAGMSSAGSDLLSSVTWWWFGNDVSISRAALRLDDAGGDDAGDAGTSDAGTSDAGDADAGVTDAGESDAAGPDAGDADADSDADAADTTETDASSDADDFDASEGDTVTADASDADADPADAGTTDVADTTSEDDATSEDDTREDDSSEPSPDTVAPEPDASADSGADAIASEDAALVDVPMTDAGSDATSGNDDNDDVSSDSGGCATASSTNPPLSVLFGTVIALVRRRRPRH